MQLYDLKEEINTLIICSDSSKYVILFVLTLFTAVVSEKKNTLILNYESTIEWKLDEYLLYTMKENLFLSHKAIIVFGSDFSLPYGILDFCPAKVCNTYGILAAESIAIFRSLRHRHSDAICDIIIFNLLSQYWNSIE